MLLARNNVAEMSDMAETLIPVRSGAGITDTISPRIKFRDMKDDQITCLSQIFIDGYVSDRESGVNLFHVNGEPFFESRNRHPGKKHFFGETMGLREGENLISFECIDFAGIGMGPFVFDMACQYRFGEEAGTSVLKNWGFSQDVAEFMVYSSVIVRF